VTKRIVSRTYFPDLKLSVKLLIIVAFVGLLITALARHVLPPDLLANTAEAATPLDIGQDCKKCHAAIVEAFPRNVHGKSAKFLEGARSASCETCHANPEKHVKTGKKEDITSPAKMPAKEINSSCLQCHSQDRHTFAWQGSKHDRKDVSCLSCHTQHHPKNEENMLAATTTEETCLRCHTSVRKAVYQRSSHLIRSEHGNMKVGCTSCHNPHGGQTDKMLVEETVNNTCYGCHAEKRGPFLWEHPPARENCMSCHSPHGSSNTRLLTQRANLQCQQCHIHMLPRHSTLAGKPLDIWTLNRGCVNCHSQVHGSNHPGGRTFTR
jgi:DmsE family decaheme c-type cytochrome